MSKNLTNNRKYIPAKQAAEILGYSTTTLRNWARQGIIPAMLSPGGRYRYDVETFQEMAKTASRDRLAKEAGKLKDKKRQAAIKAAAERKAKLEKRKALAAAQKVAQAPKDEPYIPMIAEADKANGVTA
jgi:DNA-binding transcriptional MerR regulator